MIFLTAMDFTLPLADPVLKFLIILLIILGAPLLLNKIRIPPLLGLIIAGAVIGPHGFNLVLRDSSIILSGTAGLLYIMFLAGLEIDMGDFKRNSLRSLTFGLYTFCVPMALGIVAGYYLLGFSWLTSVLLASMFASHTLIAYPIISKLGISKNNAVCITVGGTMITDTLALLVLTIVVALSTGNADDMFWVRLGLSITAFTLFVLLGFPLIGRWFFKRVHDNISQYIFVLAMVFLGAFLAQLAGLEAIIGSFLAGLALNRLIPATSPLMNRVEFVGCKLLGAALPDATLNHVRLERCNGRYLNLSGSRLRQVRFTECDLTEAALNDCRLDGVAFEGCTLRSTEFSHTPLRGIDLRQSQLGDLRLTVDDLRGAIVAPSQALDLLPLLGVVVRTQTAEETE